MRMSNKKMNSIDKVRCMIGQLNSEIEKIRRETQDLEALKRQSLILIKQYDHDIRELRFLSQYLCAYSKNFISSEPSAPVETNLIESSDGEIIGQTGVLFSHNIKDIVSALEFSPNGKMLAFATRTQLFVISTETGNISSVTTFDDCKESPKGQSTRKLVFYEDSSQLIVCAPCNDILIYSTPNLGLIKKLVSHTNYVTSVAFFHNDQKFISVGFDGALSIWDSQNFDLIRKIEPESINKDSPMAVSVCVSKDDALVIVGYIDGTIGVFDSNFKSPMSSVFVHDTFLLDVALAPDGTKIATAPKDNDIKIWNMQGILKCIKTLKGHSDIVVCLKFSPNSKILFSGSKDESVRAWDIETGEQLFCIELHENTVFGIAHHPQKRMLATCSGDGRVIVSHYW